MKSLDFILLFVIFLIYTPSYGQIYGEVVDQEGLPLPGAAIFLYPDSIGTTTNIEGVFEFKDIRDGHYSVQITYIGYEKAEITIDVVNQASLPVYVVMELKSEILNEVVVSDEHAKQEVSLSAQHLAETYLEEHRQGNFAESIERLPGVNAINVGVGIAKPVIRGLSSNRIIVNQQGIKQESHQWGADHGLEVDQYDVERVEIIKGPASLQYGSDGLGGVVNIMPGKIVARNSYVGSIEGVFKSNNDHWGGSGMIGFNKNDFFVSARYSRQDFGDYKVPADQFTYNSFTLPIFNNTLKNTAGDEENLRISAGYQSNTNITRILYGHYSLDAGLFSGAVGIPRSYALEDDGNSRDVNVPGQSVDHTRISFQQTYIMGENHFDFNIGYQRNLRREFSVPEFHSIPSSRIDPGDNLALQFELKTWSGNLHYDKHLDDSRKWVIGGNVQWQENTRAGFEFLLPDFNTFRGGAFSFMEWEKDSGLTLNAGIRLDYGNNQTAFYRQPVWDSNENVIDSLVAPLTDDSFFNWSASIGGSTPLNDGKWLLKANLGKSFRLPYPAETVSNGIHHGTFRHEVGTPDLDSEHGYQLDLSGDWDYGSFVGFLAFYFNYFDNYIYLGPTFPARFSTLPEAGQIFQYRQDDAIYTGFEMDFNWQIKESVDWHFSADFVQSYNVNTGLALPFTPQPSIKNDIRWEHEHNNGAIGNIHLEIGHEYFFAAEGNSRIDRSEQATPGYQLWHIGAGLTANISGQEIRFNVQAQNLFDTSYLNHLSRYRLINIPEQGRNVVFSLKVPFSGRL